MNNLKKAYDRLPPKNNDTVELGMNFSLTKSAENLKKAPLLTTNTEVVDTTKKPRAKKPQTTTNTRLIHYQHACVFLAGG